MPVHVLMTERYDQTFKIIKTVYLSSGKEINCADIKVKKGKKKKKGKYSESQEVKFFSSSFGYLQRLNLSLTD